MSMERLMLCGGSLSPLPPHSLYFHYFGFFRTWLNDLNAHVYVANAHAYVANVHVYVVNDRKVHKNEVNYRNVRENDINYRYNPNPISYRWHGSEKYFIYMLKFIFNIEVLSWGLYILFVVLRSLRKIINSNMDKSHHFILFFAETILIF